MNIRFMRWADRWAGAPLCKLLSLLPHSSARHLGFRSPRRILIILLSEMGGIALAGPMFRELRRRFPNAALFGLSFERNREILELLEVMPRENILTIDDANAAHFVRDCIKAVRALRRHGVDTVVDLELFSRISSIFSYLSGAAVRVGFHRHTQEGLYRGDFINRPVLYNPYQHMAEQFITLAAAITSDTRPAGKRIIEQEPPGIPQLALGHEEIRAMACRLGADFPGINLARTVLINPGGGALPIRAWPAKHYAQLAGDLISAGHTVCVIGPASDRTLCRAILSSVGSERCHDLTGYTRTIRELLQLYHLVPLLIGSDGGPAQFSSLTPIAAIILYGPETPVLYASLNPRAVHLFLSLSCSPCLTAYNHRNTPCDGDARCLSDITPGLVLEKVEEVLGRSAMAL